MGGAQNIFDKHFFGLMADKKRENEITIKELYDKVRALELAHNLTDTESKQAKSRFARLVVAVVVVMAIEVIILIQHALQ